jgi:PTS system nitrogen regulatory IIA component
MFLSNIIDQGHILLCSNIISKKRLFQEISNQLKKSYGLNEDQVLSALQEREHLGTTGMGHGVAIPHARMDGISDIKGMFIRLDRPFNFESLDKQPVDLIFAIIAPKNNGVEHLKALAKVSRVLRNPDIRKKLRSTEDRAALYSILTQDLNIKAA